MGELHLCVSVLQCIAHSLARRSATSVVVAAADDCHNSRSGLTSLENTGATMAGKLVHVQLVDVRVPQIVT